MSALRATRALQILLFRWPTVQVPEQGGTRAPPRSPARPSGVPRAIRRGFSPRASRRPPRGGGRPPGGRPKLRRGRTFLFWREPIGGGQGFLFLPPGVEEEKIYV